MKLQIPGVSTAYSIASWVAHRWEVGKFETFLDRIRIRLDLDREQLLREMRENKDKKWMAEGLARGWRLSLEAMDDTARECAYLMVADYMTRKMPPDRSHRQFGNLFMESDEQLLTIFLTMADHMHEAQYPEAELDWTYDHDVQAGPRFHELILNKERAVILQPARVEEAGELLISNGFASVGTGFGITYPGDRSKSIFNTICRMAENHVALWIQLRKYLEPVRTAKSAT